MVASLPAGQRNRIENRLGKIKVLHNKSQKTMNTETINQSNEQVAARYNARKALFAALYLIVALAQEHYEYDNNNDITKNKEK